MDTNKQKDDKSENMVETDAVKSNVCDSRHFGTSLSGGDGGGRE